MELVYLASPYSHPDPDVRQDRYEAACKAAAKLMVMGYVVYSPIAHSHPISDFLPPETLMDHGFWMTQCLPIVQKCDKLFILTLDGWADSIGVRREAMEARGHNIPVGYIEP